MHFLSERERVCRFLRESGSFLERVALVSVANSYPYAIIQHYSISYMYSLYILKAATQPGVRNLERPSIVSYGIHFMFSKVPS